MDHAYRGSRDQLVSVDFGSMVQTSDFIDLCIVIRKSGHNGNLFHTFFRLSTTKIAGFI